MPSYPRPWYLEHLLSSSCGDARGGRTNLQSDTTEQEGRTGRKSGERASVKHARDRLSSIHRIGTMAISDLHTRSCSFVMNISPEEKAQYPARHDREGEGRNKCGSASVTASAVGKSG